MAIIGAGPVGSLCALAHARRGARVALFEAKPNGYDKLKGEWLHPPASRMLEQVGLSFDTEAHATKGFVVFPEDGSEPIPLPYPEGSRGLVLPHETLVLRLREAAHDEPNIDFIWGLARPTHDGRVTYTQNGVEESVIADRLVGADGRGAVVLRLLGLTAKPTVRSRMIGVRMEQRCPWRALATSYVVARAPYSCTDWETTVLLPLWTHHMNTQAVRLPNCC